MEFTRSHSSQRLEITLALKSSLLFKIPVNVLSWYWSPLVKLDANGTLFLQVDLNKFLLNLKKMFFSKYQNVNEDVLPWQWNLSS